jgi:uncharacterized membrane protein
MEVTPSARSTAVSTLFAIAYPDVQTAQRVRAELAGLQRQKLADLEDAVVVERRQDGRIKIHQAVSGPGSGAAAGAPWGSVVGLLFLMPFLAAALDGTTAAATDIGLDAAFMRRVGQHLGPGTAALFLLVRQSPPDEVTPQIARYGGAVLQTPLSPAAEEQLRETVQAAQANQAAQALAR